MRILIVHDTFSSSPSLDETDTQEQVELITQVLKEKGHEVGTLPFSINSMNMKDSISICSPDLIFNLVETLEGSSLLHLAPSLFESLGIPFTGADSHQMMLTSNKVLAKEEMVKAMLPTPRWIELHNISQASEFLGFPLIIKPKCEEASVGIDDKSVRTFHSIESLQEILSSNTLFVEEYINGREFNVSILLIEGIPVVLPPAEMLFIDYPTHKPAIVDYDAKWKEDSFAYSHTFRSFIFNEKDRLLIKELKELTHKAFTLFGNKGYMRVDFRVDSLNRPYILEVNVNPCLNIDSGFVAAAKENRINYNELIELIIRG